MSRLSRKQKIWLFFGIYIGVTILIAAITGWHRTSNDEIQPQNEFKLDNWINLRPFSINKAVLYVVMAAILTPATMIYVAKRMRDKPNRVQTTVEILFNLMRNNITRGA